MRIALVCNPDSGGGVDVDGLTNELERLGATVDDERPERLVVAGGDGSIAAAAARAGALGVPLAVIPAGTANDFARAIELPRDRAEAARLAAAGTYTRPLELAHMGDRPFVNVASTGLAPAAARRAEPLKRPLGPLAYSVGGVLAGLLERPLECRVEVDGDEVFAGRAWQLTVAASGAFGGGSEIGHADPRDGQLDVVVLPDGSRLGLVRRAIAMRRGNLGDQPGVVTARGDDVVVEVAPGTRFNVDGEVVPVTDGRARFRARAAAFDLVVA